MTSGLRLGTAAVTTQGMGTAEMDRIGELIARALRAREDASELGRIKSEVADLCADFGVYT